MANALSLPRPRALRLAHRRRRHRNPVVVAALAFVALSVLAAVVGPLLAGDYAAQDLDSVLAPPVGFAGGSAEHLLGADELGRDQLTRLIHGLRASLGVSCVALLGAASIGIAVGLLCGYVGGRIDDVVMRIADIQLTLPGLLLALTVVTILGPSFLTVALVLFMISWVVFARLARSQTLSLRQQDMVRASRSLGMSNTRIVLRHVLPNIASPLVVAATLELGELVIVAAAMSYLGLGLAPPAPSLGGMIADGQRQMTSGAWWLVVVPGVLFTLLLMSINVVGDWMREVLDPRSRTGAEEH